MGPDTDVIARVTALQPDVKNGVAKVSVPRSDLAVTVDGIKMSPFLSIGWSVIRVNKAIPRLPGDQNRIRASPTRRVTRAWSSHSRSGTAYFRVEPIRSRNSAAVICCFAAR